MFKNLMKIAALCLMFCYVAAYLVILREFAAVGRYTWLVWLGPLGLACAVYLAARITIFHVKYTRFSRRLLDGNYESGIQIHRISRDEVRGLADLTNKVADRLRLYDALRADRVAVNARAREILQERTGTPVIAADVEEGTFRFNPAAQTLFDVEQESMSIDSLIKRRENEQLADLYRAVIARNKVPHSARLSITLPVRDVTREVTADIVPIKDREEQVRFVLMFLS